MNAILSISCQNFYLLQFLLDGEMPIRQLNVLTLHSLVIVYQIFSPPGRRYLNSMQAGRINALFKHAIYYILFKNTNDFGGILLHADCTLFRNNQQEYHDLIRFLPILGVSDCVSGVIWSILAVVITQSESYTLSFVNIVLYDE
jgi:hypothetical protein